MTNERQRAPTTTIPTIRPSHTRDSSGPTAAAEGLTQRRTRLYTGGVKYSLLNMQLKSMLVCGWRQFSHHRLHTRTRNHLPVICHAYFLYMDWPCRVKECSNMFGRTGPHTFGAPTHVCQNCLWGQGCLLVKIRKSSQNKLVESMHYFIHKFLMCKHEVSY